MLVPLLMAAMLGSVLTTGDNEVGSISWCKYWETLGVVRDECIRYIEATATPPPRKEALNTREMIDVCSTLSSLREQVPVKNLSLGGRLREWHG